MNEFDKIIGYSGEKLELEQVCDILRNREVYAKLGVDAPNGLLLHGDPGVGKTMMAKAVAAMSGLETFTCRKNEPNGEFIKVIRATFESAARHAPAIVFLDDMDKFAESGCGNAEEFITVQACIDDNKGKGIFVLATCNDIDDLPDSLLRAGRFDKVMEIKAPRGKDAEKIVQYYLSRKKFVSSIDISFITRMLDGRSCAELESIINDAGIYAGFERSDDISMDHLIRAMLSRLYEVPATELCKDYAPVDLHAGYSDAAAGVYHEAGHVVIAETLYPGSVTIVSSFHKKNEDTGFTMTCNYQQVNIKRWKSVSTVIGLGGKAAIERKFGSADEGSANDIREAHDIFNDELSELCIHGFDLYSRGPYFDSDSLKQRLEQSNAEMMEQAMGKAREILAVNHRLFERIAEELALHGILTMNDIRGIINDCGIIPVPFG